MQVVVKTGECKLHSYTQLSSLPISPLVVIESQQWQTGSFPGGIGPLQGLTDRVYLTLRACGDGRDLETRDVCTLARRPCGHAPAVNKLFVAD